MARWSKRFPSALVTSHHHPCSGPRHLRMADAQMKFKKLRIVWSVICGLACILLMGLWIRSYWWADDLIIKLPNPQRQFQIHSLQGGTLWYCNDYPSRNAAWTHKYWRNDNGFSRGFNEGFRCRSNL